MANKLIKINLEPVQARILASLPMSGDRERIIKGLGAAAAQYWKKIAQERLRSTSRDYIAGIQPRIEGDKAIIELVGSMPNMVEQGIDGFDLRDTLLKGPNVKYGKNGPYNTVPFRHGTPGSGGRNVGIPMPAPIHNAAQKLMPTLSRPGAPIGTSGGQTVIYGQRLHPGLPMQAKARAILQGKQQPWHATSVYMGMIRKGKEIAGGKIQTTGYTTFRRISRYSSNKEKHWMHPGIKARNLARDVQSHLESIASDIVISATR